MKSNPLSNGGPAQDAAIMHRQASTVVAEGGGWQQLQDGAGDTYFYCPFPRFATLHFAAFVHMSPSSLWSCACAQCRVHASVLFVRAGPSTGATQWKRPRSFRAETSISVQ